MFDSCLEELTPLAGMGAETERTEMLTKRLMETPLPVESDRTSAKRRRRTRYTPLPGILETRCTWLRVRGRLRDAPDGVDGVRDDIMGGGLASLYPVLGATILRAAERVF